MNDSASDIGSKPVIVMDLEDTLVYVTPLPLNCSDNSNYFTIKYKKRKFYVQLRPHLHDFLEKLEKLYDIYIFTASSKVYANLIINKIFPNIKNNCRFFRDSCINMCGYFVKDLCVIKRPLQTTLLIDDSAGSAINNPKNLVKVKPWNGEEDDMILEHLLAILESIALDNDLRESFNNAVKIGNYEGINTF